MLEHRCISTEISEGLLGRRAFLQRSGSHPVPLLPTEEDILSGVAQQIKPLASKQVFCCKFITL